MPVLRFFNLPIRYDDVSDLAEQLDLTKEEAQELINEQSQPFILSDKSNSNFIKTAINEKLPFVILKAFSDKDITPKKILDRVDTRSYKISDSLKGKDQVIGNLSVDYNLNYTYYHGANKVETVQKNLTIPYKGNVEELEETVIDFLEKKHKDDHADIEIVDMELFSPIEKSQSLRYDQSDRSLKAPKYLNIFGTKTEVLDDCVRDYLIQNYKISRKKIEKIGSSDGVSAKEIVEFLKQYNIQVVIYDILGNIIASNFPKVHNKRHKKFYALSHTNHLYHINNKYINKQSYYKEIRVIKNIYDEIRKLLENKEYPQDIRMDNNKIQGFTYNNIRYIDNPEYEQCKSILEKFGIQDKIFDHIKLTCIPSMLEKLYSIDCKSYIPNSKQFKRIANTYNDENYKKEDYKDLSAIDINKCYPTALRDLPYLIKTDYRYNKIHIYNNEPIVDHYLYLVNIDKQQLPLFQINSLYTGEKIKYAQSFNVKFEIKEYIETEKIPNQYRILIIDLFDRFPESVAKQIIVRMIGIFESQADSNIYHKFEQITDKEGLRLKNNQCKYYKQLSSEYYAIFNEKEYITSIYNRYPIAVQVKDRVDMQIHKKILEFGINNTVSIQTDCIIFKGPNIYTSDKTHGKWKIIDTEYKEFYPIENKNSTLFMHNTHSNSTLYNASAGYGKTHYIIENLIPRISKDYIVFTPSHNALKVYKKSNINSDIIHTPMYKNEYPKEHNIIIDEIGLCDKKINDYIIKLHLLGKNIYSFGDFDQLKPVNEEHVDLKQYLNYIYKDQCTFTTNYRNDFSKEYYAHLKTRYKKNDIIKEIKKNGCKDFTSADMIICYRRKTVEKYNKLMMEHLNESTLCVNHKTRCITNKLRDYEIYNNYTFTVVSSDEYSVTLNDEIRDYTIKLSEYLKYFIPNYATTLYSVQGLSVYSYYFPPEDYNCMDGRALYTLISRLKK